MREQPETCKSVDAGIRLVEQAIFAAAVHIRVFVVPSTLLARMPKGVSADFEQPRVDKVREKTPNRS